MLPAAKSRCLSLRTFGNSFCREQEPPCVRSQLRLFIYLPGFCFHRGSQTLSLEKGFATVSLLPIEGVFLDHFLQSPSKENVSGQKKHCCTVYTHLYYVSKKSTFFLNPQETTTPHPLSKGGGRLPLAILRIV